MKLTSEVTEAINLHLEQVRQELGNLPPDEQRDILQTLEAHIHDALESRTPGETTIEMLDAIIAEMDPPESYRITIPTGKTTAGRWKTFGIGFATACFILAAIPVACMALNKNKAPGRKASNHALVGDWISVDFVSSIELFNPTRKNWQGDLYLKHMTFNADGTTHKPWWTWKDNILHHDGDNSDAKLLVKTISGNDYLFMEWMSGDVLIRKQKPKYYVLKRKSRSERPKQASLPVASGRPVVVVQTHPRNNSENISPSVDEIRLTFSKDMKEQAWSWCRSELGAYPETTGKPWYLEDKRTCVLPVKLRPNTQYALRFNIEGRFENFRGADGRPAVPYQLTFKTGNQVAKEAQAPVVSQPQPTSGELDVIADKTIKAGVGCGKLKLGMSRKELVAILGEPEQESTERWLRWQGKQYIHCLLNDDGEACELRFDSGFPGTTEDGVRHGQVEEEVLKIYGRPDHVMKKNGAKKLEWSDEGILVWLTPKRGVHQIVVFNPY
jgi:hypothetical protein